VPKFLSIHVMKVLIKLQETFFNRLFNSYCILFLVLSSLYMTFSRKYLKGLNVIVKN